MAPLGQNMNYTDFNITDKNRFKKLHISIKVTKCPSRGLTFDRDSTCSGLRRTTARLGGQVNWLRLDWLKQYMTDLGAISKQLVNLDKASFMMISE